MCSFLTFSVLLYSGLVWSGCVLVCSDGLCIVVKGVTTRSLYSLWNVAYVRWVFHSVLSTYVMVNNNNGYNNSAAARQVDIHRWALHYQLVCALSLCPTPVKNICFTPAYKLAFTFITYSCIGGRNCWNIVEHSVITENFQRIEGRKVISLIQN